MTPKKTPKTNYEKAREQLFDSEIAPLAKSLAEKCNEFGFPMYSSILISEDKDSLTTNISIMQNENMPNRMQLCAMMTRETGFADAVANMILGALELNRTAKELGLLIDAKEREDEPKL